MDIREVGKTETVKGVWPLWESELVFFTRKLYESLTFDSETKNGAPAPSTPNCWRKCRR